ncbi:hypothetical protein ACIBF1_39880 [Spirillospora sp. NPDC050679]
MSLDDIIEHAEPAHEVPPLGAGARELLDEITATPRRAPRRRFRPWFRMRFAVPVLAGLTAAAVLAGWTLPGLGARPAAALDIRQEGGYYIVTVEDHFAEPQRYAAQLRERGLDIDLQVKPVSPGLEGMIFTPYDPRLNNVSEAEQARRTDLIVPIERPGACAAFAHCAVGLKIPVGYRAYQGPDHRGPARIMLGRRARPGERYVGFGQLNNPGEPLACRKFAGKRVGEVVAMLRERGATVTQFAVPQKGFRSSVPEDWYVHEGWLTEPGKALLVADAKPSAKRGWTVPDCKHRS